MCRITADLDGAESCSSGSFNIMLIVIADHENLCRADRLALRSRGFEDGTIKFGCRFSPTHLARNQEFIKSVKQRESRENLDQSFVKVTGQQDLDPRGFQRIERRSHIREETPGIGVSKLFPKLFKAVVNLLWWQFLENRRHNFMPESDLFSVRCLCSCLPRSIGHSKSRTHLDFRQYAPSLKASSMINGDNRFKGRDDRSKSIECHTTNRSVSQKSMSHDDLPPGVVRSTSPTHQWETQSQCRIQIKLGSSRGIEHIPP